jgi:hypothetical protein
MRPKRQTNLERNHLNRPTVGCDLTEKQFRANKIAAERPSLEAWVR